MAPSLLLFGGRNPHLGGTILTWGAQAVIWGALPRNDPPRGVGPACFEVAFLQTAGADYTSNIFEPMS